MKTMNEFITELKGNGFSVYTSDTKENPTYIYFVKDNKIGYCQINDFSYYSFSTVHKPCRRAGTGYNVYDETTEPTTQKAVACFVIIPRWATKRYWGRNARKAPEITKYKSWDDYLNHPINQILNKREL